MGKSGIKSLLKSVCVKKIRCVLLLKSYSIYIVFVTLLDEDLNVIVRINFVTFLRTFRMAIR